MIKYIVAHRKDPNNIGDIASNPLQYFLKSDQYQTIDAAHLIKESYPLDVPLILGGGGLIGNSVFGNIVADALSSPDELQLKIISQNKWKPMDPNNNELHGHFKTEFGNLMNHVLSLAKKPTAPRYVWGAGHNAAPGEPLIYPEELNQYQQVGVRDSNTNFTWAPCASCMHPAFRKKYNKRHRAIWFEHKKQLIKDRDFGSEPMLRFTNTGTDMDQTIELLASAEIVLTNSYHGAYWATLLGCRVIVVGPWSTKFDHMRHPPVQIPLGQPWQEAVDQTQQYNHALEECQAATENFWNKIR